MKNRGDTFKISSYTMNTGEDSRHNYKGMKLSAGTDRDIIGWLILNTLLPIPFGTVSCQDCLSCPQKLVFWSVSVGYVPTFWTCQLLSNRDKYWHFLCLHSYQLWLKKVILLFSFVLWKIKSTP